MFSTSPGNGPEFLAAELKKKLASLSVQRLTTLSRKLWENGYCESFNGKLRDKPLNGEVFATLKEAEAMNENR